MPYKNTLNIPITKFPMRASLVANESKFQEFWNNQQIYLKLSNRSNSSIFVLHDGPPYANGNIHLGHALNKVLKDFILRYKALNGYSIDYVPGWDTHGLPIENKVEEAKFYNNKNSVDKRLACRAYALDQIENQRSQFLRLHLLADFNNKYRTLDASFINQELNNFYYFLENDLLYWDLKPVAWSWSSRTALAESEIIYKEVEAKSIYFWFPVHQDYSNLRKGTRLLIWTTTPYTLEANLAVAVNPEFRYELIRTKEGDEYLLLEGIKANLGLDGADVIDVILGKDLEGIKYENPVTKEIRQVILGDFVVKDTGTGLVHVAPGYGLEDYYACLKLGINAYVSIKDDGCFISDTKFEPINNLFYLDANEVVISWLDLNKYLFKEQIIKHNIGHDWRTDKTLLYKASPQWFINISKLKTKINKSIYPGIKSSPSWFSKKLEELILNREEWCLSRQRVWGTPIPILFDENKKPILELKQVRHIIDLIAKEGVEIWFEKDAEYFLHPEFRDIYKKVSKSGDILDVWFDSGCSWGILERDKVADLYLEGFDQLRGWFNSSAIISIAIRGYAPFKELLSHGFVLDKDGNKMSKSKGNVVDPIELIEQYGVDVIRLWIGLNNYLEDIKISKESLDNAVSLYKKIRNTVFRYSLSVLPDGFRVDPEILSNLTRPENKYIYQLFRESWIQIEQHLSNYYFFKATKTSLNFLNIYSSWYLEICKDVLYCNSTSSRKYIENINIIAEIFEKYLFFYSIFMPQTAEEAWGHYRSTGKSIFLEIWPKLSNKEYKVDKGIWDKFWKLRDEVYLEIEKLKNEKILSGNIEAKVVIKQNIGDLDLVKLLNVGQVEIGEELLVGKCNLPVCLRCKRHKEDVDKDSLCSRCLLLVSQQEHKK